MFRAYWSSNNNQESSCHWGITAWPWVVRLPICLLLVPKISSFLSLHPGHFISLPQEARCLAVCWVHHVAFAYPGMAPLAHSRHLERDLENHWTVSPLCTRRWWHLQEALSLIDRCCSGWHFLKERVSFFFRGMQWALLLAGCHSWVHLWDHDLCCEERLLPRPGTWKIVSAWLCLSDTCAFCDSPSPRGDFY